MSEGITYQRVESGPYKHQVTVRDARSWLARLLGLPSRERVFVNKSLTRGFERVGWVELPDMADLSCIGPLAQRIQRTIRQEDFAGHVEMFGDEWKLRGTK